MTTQTLSEFASRATFPPADPDHLKLAESLIREHRALDLRLQSVADSGLPLAVWLEALLRYSRAAHFVKYDPWDASIVVKSFPPSPLVALYNPFRDPANRHAEGQRPAPAAGAKPDFLAWESFPENEHYLVWTAASGRHYGVLVQPAPIVPDHFIIASLDADPDTRQHYPQVATASHLADTQELCGSLFPLEYAVGYNDRGAGASVDHFHTQAVPKRFLPLVRLEAAGGLAAADAWTDGHGVRLEVLDAVYPWPGILLRATSLSALLRQQQVVLHSCRMSGLIYNSLAWRNSAGEWVEAVFPRGNEAIINNKVKAGYVETSGMLVIPDRGLFETLQNAEIMAESLKGAGLDPQRMHEWLEMLKRWFLKV
ncbi:MAG: DUF4922 domain-containing protein [candidate division FCPU426 bacterium]